MKTCNKCHQEKPPECFGKNKSTYDGLDHYCKECRREYRASHKEEIQQTKAKYRAAHREEINTKKREAYVPHPRATFTEEEKKEKRAAYYLANRERKLAYRKEYYAANKNKCQELTRNWARCNRAAIKANRKQWRADHPDQYRAIHKAMKHRRRARIKGQGGSYTQEQLHECLTFFGYCCAYSGEPLTPGYHLDHVQPLSKGGQNTIHNIVPSCPAANCDKQDQDWESWYSKQSYFSQERYEKILGWITNP